MTAWDLVAVVVTACAIVTMAVLLLVLFQLVSVLRELRSAADRLADDAITAVDVFRETVNHEHVELQRLQGVIGAAEEVSENLRSAGRAATRIATTPAIKGRAIVAGLKSGLGRLKRG